MTFTVPLWYGCIPLLSLYDMLCAQARPLFLSLKVQEVASALLCVSNRFPWPEHLQHCCESGWIKRIKLSVRVIAAGINQGQSDQLYFHPFLNAVHTLLDQQICNVEGRPAQILFEWISCM